MENKLENIVKEINEITDNVELSNLAYDKLCLACIYINEVKRELKGNSGK